MKLKVISTLAIAAAALYAAPASATIVLPGTTVIASPDLSPPGTLLASTVVPGNALTFTGTLYSAVYQEASGTLDFLYQVQRTGGTEPIDKLTASSFAGYIVDAQEYVTGFGPFLAPTHADTATINRSATGGILTVDWGANALTDGSISDIYVFRTNARDFTQGTFGVLDGSSFQGFAFAPTGPVPEPATWGMMLLGFLGIGAVMRRKRAASHIAQVA